MEPGHSIGQTRQRHGWEGETQAGTQWKAELGLGVGTWGAGCTDGKERRSTKLRERAYCVPGDPQIGL